MGPELGTYKMFKHAGAERPMGGMSNMAKHYNLPAHWLYYAKVEDIDAAINRIKSKGGTILNGPMEVPRGKVAQCRDPQGAPFAIHADNP